MAPSGGAYASGARDGQIRLWRPGRSRPLVLRPRLQGSASGLAFTPDGRLLVSVEGARYERQLGSIEAESGPSDGRVHLWDAQTGALLFTFEDGHTGGAGTLVLTKGGERAITLGRDRQMRRFDLSALEQGEPLQSMVNPRAAVGTPLADVAGLVYERQVVVLGEKDANAAASSL